MDLEKISALFEERLEKIEKEFKEQVQFERRGWACARRQCEATR